MVDSKGVVKLPKVLVFTVTYKGKDYVWDRFQALTKKMTYPNYEHIIIDNTADEGQYASHLRSYGFKVFHIERGNNTREAIARSQEFARRYALKNGFDYMLSLESDILVIDKVIEWLLSDGKDYVGALYHIGNDQFQRIPCITIPYEHEHYGLKGNRLLKPEEYDTYYRNGLMTVNNCGLGCTLIKKSVFEKVSFKYLPMLKTHSDSYYANDVWNAGFRIYVDTDLVLEHVNNDWSKVSDR